MLRLTFDIMPQQVHLNFAFTEFFSHAPQPNHKKKHNTDENDNQPYSAVHRLDYPSRLVKRAIHKISANIPKSLLNLCIFRIRISLAQRFAFEKFAVHAFKFWRSGQM